MRRTFLLATALITLIGLVALGLSFLLPIGHRTNPRAHNLEPKCADYHFICSEGCREREREPGSKCFECCDRAKSECETGADYTAQFGKCIGATPSAIPSR